MTSSDWAMAQFMSAKDALFTISGVPGWVA
jgi:hypothetical protein